MHEVRAFEISQDRHTARDLSVPSEIIVAEIEQQPSSPQGRSPQHAIYVWGETLRSLREEKYVRMLDISGSNPYVLNHDFVYEQ